MPTIIQKIYSAWQAKENCEITNNTEWKEKWANTLREIEKNHLPHGSGFDNGTKIEKVTDQKITLKSAYHLMDDNGFYREWIDFIIIVRPGFDTISVEAVGQFSRLQKKSYGYGIKDYIEEEFYNCLTEEEKENA